MDPKLRTTLEGPLQALVTAIDAHVRELFKRSEIAHAESKAAPVLAELASCGIRYEVSRVEAKATCVVCADNHKANTRVTYTVDGHTHQAALCENCCVALPALFRRGMT